MAILAKLFGPNKIKPSALKKPPASPAPPDDRRQRPLRIVHAGGPVERYYMAVPAAEIMNKHHKSVLARPDVFHRPWDSIVRPEEILTPGDKFYVVPRGTVRKLQRRIKKPAWKSETGSDDDGLSFMTTSTRKPCRESRTAKGNAWQPSLVSIDETSP